MPAVAQNAYITNQGVYPNFSNTVTVIDATTTRVDVGLAPAGVAVTPDGSKVYVANEAVKGTVSVTDTATNAVSATVAVGRHPTGVTTSKEVATIDVGLAPFGVAVTPDGGRADVTN